MLSCKTFQGSNGMKVNMRGQKIGSRGKGWVQPYGGDTSLTHHEANHKY